MDREGDRAIVGPGMAGGLRPLPVFGNRGKNHSGVGMGDADFRQRHRRLEADGRVQLLMDDPEDQIAVIGRAPGGAVGLNFLRLQRGDGGGQTPRGQRVKAGFRPVDPVGGQLPQLLDQRIDDQDVGLLRAALDHFRRIDLNAAVLEVDCLRQIQPGEGFGQHFGIAAAAEKHHPGRAGRGRHPEKNGKTQQEQPERAHVTPPGRRSWSRLRAGRRCRAGRPCPRLPRGSS
ncbi:hypothetical protein SDC9_84595 [bioreactor metagenome]|uniref:Uncharacterized protein n=1 Tax=bioreactor metagenome TaxID=1076179 RepID=A0A644ZH09_9ZZZZ